MKRLNNVDLEKVQTFGEEIKKNPAKARRTQVLEGEWIVKEGQVQFHSPIQFEGGKTTFEADNPTFMGGGGSLPGPMHYCFFGLASCYTGVFATIAAMLGIELKQVKTRVEADLNFSRMVGLGDEPPMEEVRVKLTVVSDAPPEKIKEAEKLAQQRCPVVYTMRNIVKLTPTLEIIKEK
jgi:uncharacterized OsmC-like protein